jgi:hypothetical protein
MGHRIPTLLAVAFVLASLWGCEGSSYVDDTAAFRQHIGQRLDRIARRVEKLQKRSPGSETFVVGVKRELRKTRRELAALRGPVGPVYARKRRQIRQATDDLEYRMERVGS